MSDGMEAMGRVITEGRAVVATASEAGRAGQWAEAAAILEAWADRVTAAVESLRGADLSEFSDETIASLARTVACAGRMHAMATVAANDAWNRAAQAGASA